MNNKYLEQNIDRLDIPMKVIEILKNNKIVKINQLCDKTKTYLKDLGLNSVEIDKLVIELQLLGLNIKTNY